MFFVISPQDSRPSLYRGCINNFIAMLLVSVYLVLLFHLIVVPLFSFWVFISMCVAFVVIALVFLPRLFQLLIGLPFLRSLLRRMFFLPYMYLVVAFYFFCCFALVCCYFNLFYIFSVSVPGDDVLRWLLSCPFSSVCFPFFYFLRTCSPINLVWFRLSCDHGWICSRSVNVR